MSARPTNSLKHPYWKRSIQTFAKTLRKEMTPAERILWGAVRRDQLGWRCCRQSRVGTFVPDFVFRRPKLIVEVDGAYHDDPTQKTKDAQRTIILRKLGYAVLRFTNEQVLTALPMVLLTIQTNLPKIPE